MDVSFYFRIWRSFLWDYYASWKRDFQCSGRKIRFTSGTRKEGDLSPFVDFEFIPFSVLPVRARSLQSCLTLCNLLDCSPPGSSVHGVLQARILEWVVMPSSRGSSQPRDRTCVAYISCTGATWNLPKSTPFLSLLFSTEFMQRIHLQSAVWDSYSIHGLWQEY